MSTPQEPLQARNLEKRHTVSIALATFNGARFIAQQLESYLQQTVLPDELIIGDDGSTDDTLSIVESFATLAPFPVRIIRNEKRLGYGANFLNLAKEAAGELVAFSDQDDIWLPNKLERSTAPFCDQLVVMSAHRAILIDEQSKKTGEFSQAIFKETVVAAGKLGSWGNFWGFSITFRKRIIGIVPSGWDVASEPSEGSSFGHDRWIYFVADSCGSTALIAEPLAMYRQHSTNLFGKSSWSLFDFLRTPLSIMAAKSFRYQEAAYQRVRILQAAALVCEHSSSRMALLDALSKWKAVHENLACRNAIYKQSTRKGRFYAFFSNFKAGVYGTSTFDRAVMKDIVVLLK